MPCTKEKLLVVDDEPEIRSSMSLLLAEIGYRVRCAQDGFSALRELRKKIPDILLSDLNMPGMSGFELLSVVRRRYPTRSHHPFHSTPPNATEAVARVRLPAPVQIQA